MVEKEKLERLRAKPGGNRGAFTKKLKDEKTLLDGIKDNQDIDDIQKGQLKVLRQFLEQKKRVLRTGETGQHCLPNTIVCFCVISYGQSTHVAIWTRTMMFG